MKQLTPNEIYRTAFKKTHYARLPHQIDSDVICPYCKNQDTDVVRDKVELIKFEDFFAGIAKKFKVYECWCCSAVWSVYE